MPQNTQRFKRVAVVFVFSSQVDSSLSFLDGFVSEALAAGAAPYKPPHQRQEEQCEDRGASIIHSHHNACCYLYYRELYSLPHAYVSRP